MPSKTETRTKTERRSDKLKLEDNPRYAKPYTYYDVAVFTLADGKLVGFIDKGRFTHAMYHGNCPTSKKAAMAQLKWRGVKRLLSSGYTIRIVKRTIAFETVWSSEP